MQELTTHRNPPEIQRPTAPLIGAETRDGIGQVRLALGDQRTFPRQTLNLPCPQAQEQDQPGYRDDRRPQQKTNAGVSRFKVQGAARRPDGGI